MHKFVDGTYVVDFQSNLGVLGGGVVTVKSGQVTGGDSGYLYEGSIKNDGNRLVGQVHVTQHNAGMASVFGPLPQFQLRLEGVANEAGGTFTGTLVGTPALKLVVNLKRHQGERAA